MSRLRFDSKVVGSGMLVYHATVVVSCDVMDLLEELYGGEEGYEYVETSGEGGVVSLLTWRMRVRVALGWHEVVVFCEEGDYGMEVSYEGLSDGLVSLLAKNQN